MGEGGNPLDGDNAFINGVTNFRGYTSAVGVSKLRPRAGAPESKALLIRLAVRF